MSLGGTVLIGYRGRRRLVEARLPGLLLRRRRGLDWTSVRAHRTIRRRISWRGSLWLRWILEMRLATIHEKTCKITLTTGILPY